MVDHCRAGALRTRTPPISGAMQGMKRRSPTLVWPGAWPRNGWWVRLEGLPPTLSLPWPVIRNNGVYPDLRRELTPQHVANQERHQRRLRSDPVPLAGASAAAL